MRVAIVLACLVVLATTADAYPQFQFSTGNERCQACHYGPAGGGLINDFGRSEAGDTISWGGDGSLLHGAWTPPDALAVGGDFRFATLAHGRDEHEPTLAAFPMQADLYLRLAGGPLALHVTGGLNGASRGRPADASLATYVVSREHYVMYQSEPGEPYVRAGRFFPVLGMRTHDHTAWVRRALGFYNLDEPYGVGVGASGATWELHTSAYAPNPWPTTGGMRRDYGVTALFERFFDDASLTAQTRYARSVDSQRILVGAIAKRWLAGPGLLVAGELDVQHEAIADSSIARLQLLAAARVTKTMLPGLLLGAGAQRWDPDVRFSGTARTAVDVDVQLFPWAHVELHLLARLGIVGGRAGTPDSLAMLQLHYYP